MSRAKAASFYSDKIVRILQAKSTRIVSRVEPMLTDNYQHGACARDLFGQIIYEIDSDGNCIYVKEYLISSKAVNETIR